MNTPPVSNLKLSAKYLGPVFSLDAEVTKRAQNLIFARNGTGKSFLSRALRYLDLHGQGLEIPNAAQYLVSDESPDGKGEFSLCRGTTVLGTLQLEGHSNSATPEVRDTIFHVFSDDFVQEELRERFFEIDGNIENEISVDSENIKLEEAGIALEQAREEENKAIEQIQTKFEQEKLDELVGKAGINKRLKEYRDLDLNNQAVHLTDKPRSPDKGFAIILTDLDSLKALPSEPTYPVQVNPFSIVDVDLSELTSLIEKITSPSSVSNEIKEKIERHHQFYQTGTKIVQDEDRTTCPFCEQDIVYSNPESVIYSYIAYFSDKEERHKSNLRAFDGMLKGKQEEIHTIEQQIAREKNRYDALKRFVPSKKDSEFENCEKQFEKIQQAISSYRETIKRKTHSLDTSISLSDYHLSQNIVSLNNAIENNNFLIADLGVAVGRADEERRTLQRNACFAFMDEFTIKYWTELESIQALRNVVTQKAKELSALESSSPSADAKSRVAETFQLLLRELFGEKYLFDEENFILRRGQRKMVRGPYRTLSDGEKTAIAFCYFVACVHRKERAESDYQKLFLVFDDPVTSMSYDYVFAIVQILKHLSISKKGRISVNPSLIDGNTYVRPQLLIMTHSSYFFNVSLTNNAVDGSSAFALYGENNGHRIVKLDKFVAPFQQQLRDIYEVANGKDPDHGTGNAIRSVLEAVGRFCRPDKSKQLGHFIEFLAGEAGITIRSVMINSLSHGSYYEEVPPPDDLRLACQETLDVVQKFAVGQLEIVRQIVDDG